MAEIRKGMLARSRAGHDAGALYVITEADDTYVYLVDGRIRTLDKPNKKKRRHIQIISRTVDITGADDAKIRRELRAARREEGKSYLTQQ